MIDDVWDTEAWKVIRLALFDNRSGSRIVVTTRNASVASNCSSDGGYVYHMEPLCFADSKRLFCKRAFGLEELCYPRLKEVMYGILEKCGGLPLAITTVSSLLVDQRTKDEWERVLTAIGSTLANNPDVGNMTKILSFSYFDLPHHLRTCFSYLSVFPEDCEIEKKHLINRWIAEGFVHEENGQSAYEAGERYFNDLINRSLIQPVDIKYGQARVCRVHDILLDFITCKAAEENFITSVDSVDHGPVSDYKVRRLCVDNRNIQENILLRGLILSHVRSLTIFGNFLQIPLSTFTALRVLDLEYCQMLQDHHLAYIEKLFHLKHLKVNSNLITELPQKIGELRYLETLDISRTGIAELPPNIVRLQRLARLYVCHRTIFPDGIIGQMQSLEELDKFGVFSYKHEKPLKEFGQLTKLRSLTIRCDLHWSTDSEGSQADDLDSCMESLISSCTVRNLRILKLYNSPLSCPMSLDSWCSAAPTTNRLQKFHITFCYISKVPNWMSSLRNLKELKLYIYSLRPEDFEILGEMPSLIFLNLKTFYGTNGRIYVCGDNKGFSSLKCFSLDIIYSGTAVEFEAGSMPKLEHLKLEFPLIEMESPMSASELGIRHLSNLTKVDLVFLSCFHYDSNYDPAADKEDSIIKSVATLIKAVAEALPNNPTIKFELRW